MFCNNCNKQIPDDSIFCIFCGSDIKKGLSESINQEVKKNDFYYNNKLLKDNSNHKRNKAIPILATFMSLFFISVIVLSIFLSVNIAMVENTKKQVSDLDNSNLQLKTDIDRISNELNNMNSNYNNLKNDYNTLENQYQILQNNNKDINNTSQNAEYISKNTNSENTFLRNIKKKILDEYNLAVNHMNTYHKKNWIYNDPSEVALEATFLVKLQELLNQLKSLGYPNSFTNERNNIINLFEQMCNYKQQQIECMKNNDFNNNTANWNSFEATMKNLFDYYNSLI